MNDLENYIAIKQFLLKFQSMSKKQQNIIIKNFDKKIKELKEE